MLNITFNKRLTNEATCKQTVLSTGVFNLVKQMFSFPFHYLCGSNWVAV